MSSSILCITQTLKSAALALAHFFFPPRVKKVKTGTSHLMLKIYGLKKYNKRD